MSNAARQSQVSPPGLNHEANATSPHHDIRLPTHIERVKVERVKKSVSHDHIRISVNQEAITHVPTPKAPEPQ